MNSSKIGSLIRNGLADETGANEIPACSENKSQASCHVSEDSHNSIQFKDSEGIGMDQKSKINSKECLLSQNEGIFSDFKNEAKTGIAKSLYAKENEMQKEATMLESPTVFPAGMLKMAETLIPERKMTLMNRRLESDNETVRNEVPECRENKSRDPCHISDDAHGITVKDSVDMKMNQKSNITCKNFLPREEIFSDSENEAEAANVQLLNARGNESQTEAIMPELTITISEMEILEIAKMFISERKISLLKIILESELVPEGNDEVPECYKRKSQDSCHASEDSNYIPAKDSEGMKVKHESAGACKGFLSLRNEDFKNETEATAAKAINTEKNYLQTKSTSLELPTTTTLNEEVIEMAKKLKISEGKTALISRLLEVKDATETNEPKARMITEETKLLSGKGKDSQYFPEECNFLKTDADEVMKESDEQVLLPYVLGSLVIGHVRESITDNTKSFTSSKLGIPKSTVNENCQASKLETEDKEQINEHAEKNDSKFPSNVRSSAKRKRKKKKNKNRKK